MHRHYIILCGLVLILSACSPQKRAARLIKRAIRLDSTLVQSKVINQNFMDTVDVGTDVEVIVPSDSVEFVEDTLDYYQDPEIIHTQPQPTDKSILFSESKRLFFEDSNFTVEVYNKNGKLAVKVKSKERSKQGKLAAPLIREIVVPCNCPPAVTLLPYTWKDKALIFLGWCFVGLGVTAIFICAFLPFIRRK